MANYNDDRYDPYSQYNKPPTQNTPKSWTPLPIKNTPYDFEKKSRPFSYTDDPEYIKLAGNFYKSLFNLTNLYPRQIPDGGELIPTDEYEQEKKDLVDGIYSLLAYKSIQLTDIRKNFVKRYIDLYKENTPEFMNSTVEHFTNMFESVKPADVLDIIPSAFIATNEDLPRVIRYTNLIIFIPKSKIAIREFRLNIKAMMLFRDVAAKYAEYENYIIAKNTGKIKKRLNPARNINNFKYLINNTNGNTRKTKKSKKSRRTRRNGL